jgi:hypothetical protein
LFVYREETIVIKERIEKKGIRGIRQPLESDWYYSTSLIRRKER